jgi:dsRNA-specific ribonuclease
MLTFHNFFVMGLAKAKEFEMKIERIFNNKNPIEPGRHMLLVPVLTNLDQLAENPETYYNHRDKHIGIVEVPLSYKEFEQKIQLNIGYIKTFGCSINTIIEKEIANYVDIFPEGVKQIREVFRKYKTKVLLKDIIDQDEELKKAVQIAENISEKLKSSVILTTYNELPYSIEAVDFYLHIDDPISKDSLSYRDYYTKKRKLNIEDSDQPLLRAAFANERNEEKRYWSEYGTAVRYFLQREYDLLPLSDEKTEANETDTKAKRAHGVVLLPQFCALSHLPYAISTYARYATSVLSYIVIVNNHYKKFEKLEEEIGYHFKNKSLLRHAMTHKTYSSENEILMSSNERLEFLGDSVLEIIVSHYLFETFKVASEGNLTFLRTQMVKNQFLEVVAKRMNILDYLLYPAQQRQIVEEALKIGANTFEAIIGAVYLDGGLLEVKELCEKFIIKEIKNDLEQRPDYQAYDFHSFEIPFINGLNLDDKQKELITELENTIGISFTNPFLILQALTHVSWGKRDNFEFKDENYIFNYERLEFLGDCILKFIVGTWLFLNYPEATESKMTLARHYTVDNMVSLAGAGERLNFRKYIRHHMPSDMMEPGSQSYKSLVSDVFEALIAAIYLDKGGLYLMKDIPNNEREYDVFGEFVHKFLIAYRKEYVNPYNISIPFKNDLQEVIQSSLPGNLLPDYRRLESIEIENSSYMTVAVFVSNVMLAIGEGASRKDAENDAARKALELCKRIQADENARVIRLYESGNKEEKPSRMSFDKFKQLVQVYEPEMHHLFSTSMNDIKRRHLATYRMTFELKNNDQDSVTIDYEEERQLREKLVAKMTQSQ